MDAHDVIIREIIYDGRPMRLIIKGLSQPSPPPTQDQDKDKDEESPSIIKINKSTIIILSFETNYS